MPTSYRDSADSTALSTPSTFALVLAFRIVNALTLRTFFQPDEFFQSLEPAWHLAFGRLSQACITWEWSTQLRSSLHPALFAAAYQLTDWLALLGSWSLPTRADLLIQAPKVTQAVFAALLDCYTWKLAAKVYGTTSRTTLFALALSIGSPWQWFCSTRTLSNCLETTLTCIAIFYWPWHWHGTQAAESNAATKGKSHMTRQNHLGLGELRLSLLLAALACILRPTNVLIWLAVSVPTLWQASRQLQHVLVREILFCGSAVLSCSLVSDRLYYGVWTLPPLRFLYFNIAQSLAVFYGTNRADYYLTEGLPLLLTTALPFAVFGLWDSVWNGHSQPSTRSSVQHTSPVSGSTESDVSRSILRRLSWACLIMTMTMSMIAHKEVRFLFPILPFLHVIAAKQLARFLPARAPLSRKSLIALLLSMNLLLAGYVSQVHQRGVIDVLTYIRHKHEASNALSSLTLASPQVMHITNTTVGFLMPCHSTPWRSHLVHPTISAWALTCEPPLNIPFMERASYLDEADQFYRAPDAWLRSNMESVETIKAQSSRSGQHWMRQDPKFKRKFKREWPQNLVFFEALQESLAGFLSESRYKECWRGFNSHWHDDWRRKGDVVVWCLD